MSNTNLNSLGGMVYIMTNSAECNQVVAFYRSPEGLLTLNNFYNTHGRGTGPREVSPATPNDGIDPLASQGSLVLSNDKRFLFAVNAGSNSISSFCVLCNGELSLIDVVPSGGLQPNSLCVIDNILYVSNVGDVTNDFNSNITGFYVDNRGYLTQIPYSSRPLSTPDAQPSCVVFSPDGKFIIASELTTNRLSVYPILKNGTTSCPVVNNSNGLAPFGSAFILSDIFVVAEAQTNALSSYVVSPTGQLNVNSGSVSNNQQATCWVSITPNEKYAYTSNNESGTISIYQICSNGSLKYIDSIYSTSESSKLGAPIDNGISYDGQFLYILNGNLGSITVFRIEDNGFLVQLQEIDCKEIPELGTQGLAVY